MTRTPPENRPTARELASRGAQPLQIAGKPADVCPYCGCGMFKAGTRKGDRETFRYVECRNCRKTFYSRQPPETLVREIGVDELPSSDGQSSLTLVRESA